MILVIFIVSFEAGGQFKTFPIFGVNSGSSNSHHDSFLHFIRNHHAPKYATSGILRSKLWLRLPVLNNPHLFRLVIRNFRWLTLFLNNALFFIEYSKHKLL